MRVERGVEREEEASMLDNKHAQMIRVRVDNKRQTFFLASLLHKQLVVTQPRLVVFRGHECRHQTDPIRNTKHAIR